jgi:hypothetical protein
MLTTRGQRQAHHQANKSGSMTRLRDVAGPTIRAARRATHRATAIRQAPPATSLGRAACPDPPQQDRPGRAGQEWRYPRAYRLRQCSHGSPRPRLAAGPCSGPWHSVGGSRTRGWRTTAWPRPASGVPDERRRGGRLGVQDGQPVAASLARHAAGLCAPGRHVPRARRGGVPLSDL